MNNLDQIKYNYEKLVNLTPELLSISDMSGYFKYVNPAFETILGYSKLEMLELSRYDLIHQEDKPILDNLATLLREKSNQFLSFELRYKCKNGTYKWIAWNVNFQVDEQLLYSSGHDITERKNAEIELHGLKDRLEDIQKYANIGYWQFNIISGEYPWSDELFHICGLKPQEFIPSINDFINMLHPDDRTLVINSLNGPLISDELELDLRIVTPDKQIIWIYEKIKYELDQSGNPIQMYGIVQDITQRKLDEAKLKENEEKYRELANNVPAGILSYDIKGNLTFVNPKVLEILGSPSEELTMTFNVFEFPQLIKYGISDVFKKCIESGNLISAEKQYDSKWGKSTIIRMKVTPIKDSKGNVVSAIAILDDFTERKWLETQVHIAKEQAELSNNAKSQFLANMSHEIRTPMNGIMGMAYLLKQTNLTDEQSEMTSIIRSSSESLLNIINDILDLSKIDAGKVELNYEPIDILNLISSISNLFSFLAKDKGLDFEVTIENDVPKEIIVDKTRLSQILSNLIGNAIKFTEKGKVTVSIKNIETTLNRAELFFSISDTGIGIKEQDIPKLFNYFTQLDNFLTKRFSGTGLGLAISKRLVELIGGEIGVKSEYGVGSTFYFTCLADIPKKEKDPLTFNYTSTIQESKAKLNILLVEDDYVSQLIIKQICKLKSWNLKVVSNGQQALDILEINPYDFILMGIRMPGMSGFDTTTIIREKEKITGERITIIAMTAYAMSQDKERCLNAGMDDFISKPVDIQKFYEVIEKWTEG